MPKRKIKNNYEPEGKYKQHWIFLLNNYETRLNEVNSKLEIRDIARNQKWKIFDDYDLSNIYNRLIQHDVKLSVNDIKHFIFSPETMMQVYNPFIIYFDSLPIWDLEDDDYITELANTVDCTNNDIFNSIFKKWMVKSIKCLFEDNYVNDSCLVLLGKQNTYKTTFINNLLPERMRDEYYTSKYINMQKDDDWKLLYQYWLINFDEMAAVKNKNNNENLVKMYMSNPKIDNRQLFKETFDYKHRIASFMGSSNDTDFLKDLTGERRFAICEVKSIDINECLKINRDEVWAQAYSLYRMDYDHEFTASEKEYLYKATTEVRQMDFDEELIVKHYSFQREDEDGVYVSSSDVVNYLTEQYPRHSAKFNSIRIGKIMKMYVKHSKIFTGNVNKYWIKYTVDNQQTNEGFSDYEKNRDVPKMNLDNEDDMPF